MNTVRTNSTAPEGWRYLVVRIPKLNGTWRFAMSEVDQVQEGT